MSERPELEEFIQLSSNPNSPWGMADVDTIAICQYALSLEALVERQRKALESAREIETWLLAARQTGDLNSRWKPVFEKLHAAMSALG